MSDPATIKLFGYASLGELPDLSPYVAKLEAYLRLAEVPYSKRPGDPRKAPRGKLPYIVHEGRAVPDSQRIIEYLREQQIAHLDEWLDAEQRADLFALRSMLEADLYFIMGYFRWQDEAGWAAYGKVIGEAILEGGAPKLMLPLILRSVRKSAVAQFVGQGAGLRDRDENLAHARELFAVLERLVGRHEGPWWFGDRPSSADAIAHAFVGALILPKLGTPLDDLADDRPRLREWFDHVHARVVGN